MYTFALSTCPTEVLKTEKRPLLTNKNLQEESRVAFLWIQPRNVRFVSGGGGKSTIFPNLVPEGQLVYGVWEATFSPSKERQKLVCCGGAVVEDIRLPPDPDKEQVGRIPPVPTKKDAGSGGADDHPLNTCGAAHLLPAPRTIHWGRRNDRSPSPSFYTLTREGMLALYNLPTNCLLPVISSLWGECDSLNQFSVSQHWWGNHLPPFNTHKSHLWRNGKKKRWGRGRDRQTSAPFFLSLGRREWLINCLPSILTKKNSAQCS